MGVFSAFHYPKWSMRRKLFGYMILLAAILLLALMAGLFLFGRFDSTERRTFESLDIQMEVFEKDVSTHFDRLAAESLHLSEDMTVFLEEYLAEQEITFSDLTDSDDNIAQIQDLMIEQLRQTLLQEDCSGVFVMWDTTVNQSVANAEFSRTGVYLQQNGYKNTDESILLYRGLAEVGKKHGIMPHRKWRLEFQTDQFPSFDEVCALSGLPLEKSYYLTERFTLPGTSEEAVLMVAPIVGTDGTFYGICGYEVSASYFTTYHAQPTKIAHLTCLLTSGGEQTLDADAGLSCGVAGDYYRTPNGQLSVKSAGDGLSYFNGDEVSYIGLTREISLSPNNQPHTMAVMMLRADHDRAVMKSFLQNAVLWALLLFFAVSCCLYFSRHYLKPILKGLEQIKSEDRTEIQSSVPEINDLFVFLAEQDRQHEESLDAVTREKQSVQQEKDDLQIKYEQAQLTYDEAQAEYTKAQSDLADAKKELDRLAYSRKNEIDPDDFQNFLQGILGLTKMERSIFDWYVEGKTAKEILALTGIKEGTLKFHNHNILNKLGVSSRKQMLRYAALMNQQNQGGCADDACGQTE